MATLQPYISFDLETTGLNLERSQIVQIAAVYDNGVTPIDQLPRYNVFINEPITYAEGGALALHEKSQLFTKLQQANKIRQSKSLYDAIELFLDFIDQHRRQGNGFKYRISLAGKNAGTYDLPILRRWMQTDQRKRFETLVYSSIIDVGSIYFSDFGRVPSLDEILTILANNQMQLKKDVSHDALDDSIDVVVAIRYKMQIKK